MIQRSSNKTESEKSQALRAAEEHLTAVSKERSHFRTVVDESKCAVRRYFTRNDTYNPPSSHCQLQANAHPITVHYPFDFVQQIHYPSNPHQHGPIYFLTPRKCGIFGVCCEAIPRQINYLIDEAVDVGKGANTVISLLHHFFETHGLGEKHVHLHADNCVGQNKNNTMMHYLAWRVINGLHDSIKLSFMLVGHTKFSPDACFRLLKRRFRRTKVDCLDDIVAVVRSSADVNEAQLVGTQGGTDCPDV